MQAEESKEAKGAKEDKEASMEEDMVIKTEIVVPQTTRILVVV